MYEKVTYENHSGKKLEFGDGKGLYINSNDLRDYSWSYTTVNSKIGSFYKSIEERKLPIVIFGKTEAEVTEMKNDLTDVVEADVMTGEKGKIWIGNYYLEGFISKSTKSKYNVTNRFLKNELVFVSDYQYWSKIEEKTYRGSTTESLSGGYDFEYDYAYDFQETIASAYLINDSAVPANFILRIYGPLSSINVTVGDISFIFDVELKTSEYAVINSRDKTAYHVSAIGEKQNIFPYRDKSYDIFAKIPAGFSAIERAGDIDIELIYERSEPEWT